MMQTVIRLSEVAVGALAMVKRLECRREMRMRLLAMGLVPGVEVKVRSRAPMGDPTNYEVKRYSLSLRNDEAACVLVELVPVMTVADAEPGKHRVVGITGGRAIRTKLWEAGIAADVVLEKDGLLERGPVSVRVRGRTIQIARGLAGRVHVVGLEQSAPAGGQPAGSLARHDLVPGER
jgi:ferrous iron transport protein A